MRPLRTFGQNGCPNCLLFSECGGHPLPLIYRIGCANSAASVLGNTDDMHPNLEERFWELWRDTGGLADHSVSSLRPIETSGLPRYIPVLQNWHLWPAKPLALDVVSIPLFKVIGKLPGGGYGNMPRYRVLATKLHPFLFSLAARKWVTESTNGFRAFRTALLRDPRIDWRQPWLDQYELEPYLLFKAIRLGYRTTEAPVTKIYPPKKLGYTKMKPMVGWWSILRPVVYLGLGLKK